MIRKAVIPAAGFGSRFLPATKAQPKEMLPIIDKPTIQYVIEEAAASGIEQILIITGKGKQSIENHFDRSFELEHELLRTGKKKQYEEILALSDMAEIFYIRQKELNGLGDAIRYAKHFVNDEPFVVMLGDTIIKSKTPCSRQLIDVYSKYKKTIIGVEKVPAENVSLYGIIDPVHLADNIYDIKGMVEKPSKDAAPSDMAIAGRYILTPDIFDYLEKTPPSKNNEIQLTDALEMLRADKGMLAAHFEGRRYDIGNKLGYLKTEIEYAVDRSDFGFEFREYLKEFVKTL